MVGSTSPACALRERPTQRELQSQASQCVSGKPFSSTETLRKLLTILAKPLSLPSINRASDIKSTAQDSYGNQRGPSTLSPAIKFSSASQAYRGGEWRNGEISFPARVRGDRCLKVCSWKGWVGTATPGSLFHFELRPTWKCEGQAELSTVSPYPVAHGLGQRRRKAGHGLRGDGQPHPWQENSREGVGWVWGRNPRRHRSSQGTSSIRKPEMRGERTLRGLRHHRGHI